jgi:hypothetical protein
MRILFVLVGNEGRNGPVTGDTIREGGVGASGSDQSVVMVAEELVRQGHDVTVATSKTTPGANVRGVLYTNLEFEGVEDRTFSVLVTMLWFAALDQMPVIVTDAVVVWCHMQYVYSIGEIERYARKHSLRLGAVHVSEWEKRHTQACLDGMGGVQHVTIANPIMLDVADAVLSEGIERKPHHVAFTAAWCRGAEVTRDAFLVLDWQDGEFHTNDYTLCTLSMYTDPRIKEHGSCDKRELFRRLAACEYFVYPQVNVDGNVHKDTFGCVVAEACAMGCIVLTYPLGALPEAFPGCCKWMEWPEGVNTTNLNGEPGSCDMALADHHHVAREMDRLDRDVDAKNGLRKTGMRHVRENYGISKVGEKWEVFLKDLCT